MNELRGEARSWLDQHVPAMLVTILRSSGSTPRTAGTRMLVGADRVAGTIGGGHLELQAIVLARASLVDSPHTFERRFALGPALGQCCGGAIELGFAPLRSSDLDNWPDEPVMFHVMLFGAGHVGRALVDVLRTLPCRIDWVDERDEVFERNRASDQDNTRAIVTRSVVDDVASEVRLAPPDACFLVMTHSHDLDQAICEAVLRRDDCRFLGLIGSATKRERFERRLLQRGISEEQLARLTCPIGIAGIDGKEPETIAVAVAAQLLALPAT